MRIVSATFVNNEVEPGWLILKEDVPLGRRYRVDLDRVESMTLYNRDTGRRMPVLAVYVVSPGEPGYLPLMALRIEPDA